MSRVLVYDGQAAHEVDFDSYCAQPANGGFTWLHIDGHREDTPAIAERLTDIPQAAVSALVAHETRPRCTVMGKGALINLRGAREGNGGDGDHLVSIRIWAEQGRVVSVGYRPLAAMDRVSEAMLAGDIRDPGDFVAYLAQAITDELDPEVAELGDELDTIESDLDEAGPTGARRRVSTIRALAISYRRFIAPQRMAVEKLGQAQCEWLEDEDRLHLQEAADRYARMAEELEAVRERAALAHENLTDLRAEHMNLQALVLAVVALIFLPLTFITGLLGMNVEGIPFAREPWAFWGVTGFCVVVALAIGSWFVATRWLNR